jgi:hypothetical protein
MGVKLGLSLNLLGPSISDMLPGLEDPFNNLKPEVNLNNTYKFNCYLTENTLILYIKDQPVNAV